MQVFNVQMLCLNVVYLAGGLQDYEQVCHARLCPMYTYCISLLFLTGEYVA